MREHRNLTLLLNLLLKGRTSLLHPRSTIEHFWARVDDEGGKDRIAWVQHYFIANLGRAVIDELSAPIGEELEMVAPEEYYAQLGHDAKGLRVPTDLDESICLYLQLSPKKLRQILAPHVLDRVGVAPVEPFYVRFLRVSGFGYRIVNGAGRHSWLQLSSLCQTDATRGPGRQRTV